MGWQGVKSGLGDNPKDLAGRTKVSMTKLPAIAVAHGAHAMMDGAKKYDPYNWRKNRVIASIYVDAALRHLEAWFEGEELAPDSEAHHLGHAIACCGILLDAQETGNLVDDRPDGKAVMSRVLDRLAEIIRRRQAQATDDCQSGGAERMARQQQQHSLIRQDRATADVARGGGQERPTAGVNPCFVFAAAQPERGILGVDGWTDWPASWPPPKDAA